MILCAFWPAYAVRCGGLPGPCWICLIIGLGPCPFTCRLLGWAVIYGWHFVILAMFCPHFAFFVMLALCAELHGFVRRGWAALRLDCWCWRCSRNIRRSPFPWICEGSYYSPCLICLLCSLGAFSLLGLRFSLALRRFAWIIYCCPLAHSRFFSLIRFIPHCFFCFLVFRFPYLSPVFSLWLQPGPPV